MAEGGAGTSGGDAMDMMTAYENYFLAYEDLDVHRLMLQDKPRTLAYQRFVESNAHAFRDKVVVDVGAGTGILSLFAARAGAKKVYAIEASRMSEACEKIVAANGFSDSITVLHGRAEDINLPGGEQADILISEWMGFYLLHESMLSSVIEARNRLLKPDGLVLPSSAAIHICPISSKQFRQDHVDYFEDVYGFDFSPLIPAANTKLLLEPSIQVISPKQCLAEKQLVTHLDLNFVEPEDIVKICGKFKFKITKHGVLHAVAFWFDAMFESDESVTLNTGPDFPETHWKQTVIFLPQALLVSKEEVFECRVELEQDSKLERRYNITVEVPETAVDEDVDEDEEEEEDKEMQDAIMAAMMHK